MATVCKSRLTDEDCQALIGLPPGWSWVEAVGWYWASPTEAVGAETFAPLGPFQSIPAMVAAVDAEERRTRTEGW
jgi:hypothetical protein